MALAVVALPVEEKDQHTVGGLAACNRPMSSESGSLNFASAGQEASARVQNEELQPLRKPKGKDYSRDAVIVRQYLGGNG